MSATLTITLNGLRFHAFHGIYPEERKTGNEFAVDIAVTYTPESGTVTDISDTINYVTLYELTKAAMQQPRGLLETLAMELALAFHEHFPQIIRAAISIRKLHPPIAGITGDVGVEYVKEFQE